MCANFGASATLSVEVSDRDLREARAEIEDELGEVTVGVGGGGGASTVADGGSDLANLASERNDILNDILDELEEGGVGGGGGGLLGGGGGGIGGFDPLSFLLGRNTGGGGGGGGGRGGLPLGRLAGGLTTLALTGLKTDIGGAGGTADRPGRGAVSFGQFLNDIFDIDTSGPSPIDQLLSNLSGDGAPRSIRQRVVNGQFQPGASLAETVGSVTRRRRGDPLAGTNRFGDDEPGVDPSNVPSRGSEGVVNRLGDAQPGVDRSQVPSRGSGLSGDLPGRRIPGTRTVSFDQPRQLNRRQKRAILDDKNLPTGDSPQSQRITVTVENDIRSELNLSNLRELQRFLNNPERFVSEALGLTRSQVSGQSGATGL